MPQPPNEPHPPDRSQEAAPRPPLSPLFVRLIDDAGLFPPTRLDMAPAAARHRADTAAGHPALTHRFLCPAARLDELLATLTEPDRISLGLISPLEPDALTEALARIDADPRLALTGVEGPLPAAAGLGEAARRARTALDDLDGLDALPPGLPRHAEVPLADGWRAALDELAAGKIAAKVRCGGVRAELFPTVGQLAAFVYECATRRLPFKATAGLHHAVRHTDPGTGYTHHGFLNLLLAVCRAVAGGSRADTEAVLECADPAALADEARAVDDDLATTARTVFLAYGSCSTAEPLADLRALGLDSTR